MYDNYAYSLGQDQESMSARRWFMGSGHDPLRLIEPLDKMYNLV